MKRIWFWVVFALLVVLHQDWWFWYDGRLWFGFLPVGLGYHALISLAAAGLWAWAVFSVWRDALEEEPEEVSP